MPHFVAMKCISDMMNFEEKGDLCEHLSTQIPLFPRLSVTDVSAFLLVTRSGCMIASKQIPVKSNMIIFAKSKFS